MRKFLVGAAIAASLAFFSLAGASQASAQLITNGNFDDLPDLTGWQVTTGVGISLSDSLSQDRNATFNQAADTLQQTFNATAGTYILSFYVKTAGTIVGQFSMIQAAINGIVVAVGGAGTSNYAQVIQTVTLKDGANTLRFNNASFVGTPDFLRLDNVSITAVPVPGPVPGAGMLSFLGLAGAGLLARKRSRKA